QLAANNHTHPAARFASDQPERAGGADWWSDRSARRQSGLGTRFFRVDYLARDRRRNEGFFPEIKTAIRLIRVRFSFAWSSSALLWQLQRTPSAVGDSATRPNDNAVLPAVRPTV